MNAPILDYSARAGQWEMGPTAHESTAFTARIHTDLASIASRWRGLQSTGRSTVYQNFEWIASIAQHLCAAKKAELFVVEVVCAHTTDTIMLMPFMIRRRRGLTTIEGCNLGVCDYVAPLIAHDFMPTPDMAASLWKAIRAVLPPSDLLRIVQMPATLSGLVNPLARLPNARRMDLQSFGVTLEGEPETLLTRVCRASTRRDLQTSRNRMDPRGAFQLIEARTRDHVTAMFDILVEQRRKRFRDLGRFDLLNRSEVERFYRDTALEGLKGGPARIFCLTAGGVPISAAYVLISDDAMHGILLSMDDACRKMSPGLTMVAELMVWSRRQKLSYFDFTIGSLPYKRRLGALPHDLYEITETHTLRGLIVMQSMCVAERTKAWLSRNPHLFQRLRTMRQAGRRLASRKQRSV